MIGRREFAVAMASRLLAAPLIAGAQQAGRLPRLGYLGASSPTLEPEILEAFRQGLRDLGYVEGQSIAIEYRWAEGHEDRLPELATELVGLKVDVIVTTGTPGTLAAKRATQTIPIVMTATGDPLRSGLVTSLARPGGNVTGFSTLRSELEGKRLDLFKQTFPRFSRVAMLWDSANPSTKFYLLHIEAAARASHVTLQPAVAVRRVEDLDRAFAAIARGHADALFVVSGRSLLAERGRIVEFAAKSRLPAIYPYREYVEAGGLMSYSANYPDLYRGAALYVDKILKGAKPADLPVQQSARFDLVINLKTAKALGLTIPPSLLARADQVIE
jgi:putative ABC transport system substrate-binding protein